MRAFLTGAIIGLTGYTLGIIAARHLARHHDKPTADYDEWAEWQDAVERWRKGMTKWANHATPTDYTPTPPPEPHPPFKPPTS